MRNMISHEHIPAYVRDVLICLQGCGHAAYIVGGAPRDLLLGKAPHDWDVATPAPPDAVKMCVGHRFGYRTQGEKHGTITVYGRPGESESGEPWQVEVTTFRVEGNYGDGRRPDQVEFVASIEQDLARRDFTVNAIALEWPQMERIDPFCGARDLAKGVIRAIGDPAARFGEDGLRLLRAIRIRAERGCRLRKTRMLHYRHSRGCLTVSPESG